MTTLAMARFVRFHPQFDSDVLSAAQWYDSRQKELGSDFVKRVRHPTTLLVADPERRTTVDYGLRYWPIERFPFVVFYDLLDRIDSLKALPNDCGCLIRMLPKLGVSTWKCKLKPSWSE